MKRRLFACLLLSVTPVYVCLLSPGSKDKTLGAKGCRTGCGMQVADGYGVSFCGVGAPPRIKVCFCVLFFVYFAALCVVDSQVQELPKLSQSHSIPCKVTRGSLSAFKTSKTANYSEMFA